MANDDVSREFRPSNEPCCRAISIHVSIGWLTRNRLRRLWTCGRVIRVGRACRQTRRLKQADQDSNQGSRPRPDVDGLKLL
jgi:hypothetical protein